MGLFHRLKTDINNWFLNAGTWLTNVGHNIIQGMLDGMKNAMSNIGGWVKSVIVDPIVNWVKHHFGINSPSIVMAGLGLNLIEGLLKGLMSNAPNVGRVVLKIFGSIPNALGAIVGKGLIALEKLPASALKLLGGLGGKIGHFFANLFHGGPAGAGVQRWAPTVLKALGMLHLSPSLLGQVLFQMQTESGGNPNAINLTDINAQRGDPSRGLLQTIGGTFAAYHVPGTSSNIYDPLANIAAAINYAVHTYGPTLMRGGMGMGSGHGYAAGTGGAAPGWGWVGERGPELVNFRGGEMVLPTGSLVGYASGTVSAAEALAAHNRALIAAATANRRASAAAIAAYNKMVSAGASLVAAIAKITPKTTASVFATDQAKFLADLRLYFTPSVAKARSQIVINQTKEMQNLQTHMKTLSTNIANATAFQQQELSHLQSTGGIGAIGIQGVGAAGGRSILSGLTRQLTSMRNFGYAVRDLSRVGGSQALLKTVAAMDPASGTVYARKMISALNKMHAMKLAPEMINQLVALGPDAALAYVNAIQAAGPSVLKQVKSTEAALASATLGTSRGIASVVSGGAYNTGANFIAGLKSQQSALDAQFKHLGKTLGQEAIKWMHVPYNKRPYGYAGGGWINEPVSGVGMYTGSLYTFAETGREYVLPEGQMGARGGDGAQYHAHFDGLTRASIESHVRTAFKAMSFQQGALNRAGRRS
jgi:SLT domain-containing protein